MRNQPLSKGFVGTGPDCAAITSGSGALSAKGQSALHPSDAAWLDRAPAGLPEGAAPPIRREMELAKVQRPSCSGIFSWHVTTDEVTWSEQLYRLFRLDRNVPATLQAMRTRVHPDDLSALDGLLERARAYPLEIECECRLDMPDASTRNLLLTFHPLWDEEGRREYLGVCRDVTEHRICEEALRKARIELTHLARFVSLGAMTASIAHEVNQPLSGIITNANACLRMLAADPPNIEGAKQTSLRTLRDGNRASEIVTRLRTLFSRQDTSTSLVDLNQATREVLGLVLSDLQSNGITVRQELAEQLPPVFGDYVQLQQVVLNLLQNARDAMSTVDDRPRRLVIRTDRESEKRICLTVQDTGVGIASASMDNLFAPFYTTKKDGLGIGLSVSRSVVESHHGEIWAAPGPGSGATFCISIPCAGSVNPERASVDAPIPAGFEADSAASLGYA